MQLNPTLITFFLYILMMCAIGIIAYRYTQNFSDYILGGRRIGSFVTAMSAGASDMSGWLLLGLPGAAYAGGFVEGWIAIGLTLGAWLNWYLIAGRLRVHTEFNHNALTLPEYLHRRFEDPTKLLKVISASIILIFFTLYCSSGIVSGARLFESLFGYSYHTSLFLGVSATILYTFLGGFLAVSWTDTIQASLMIFALILTPIVVVIFCGGLGETYQLVQAKNSEVDFFNLFQGTSVLSIISLMAWGLGYFGQPHILARFMAAESAKTMKNARRIGITWMILCLAGAMCVGVFGIAFFQKMPHLATNVNANHELIFIELSRLLFNPWIAGILLSAILAAIMSTLSCQLLVCASAITEDFYKGFLKPKATQKELVWVGRSMVLLVAIIAIVMAWDENSSVLKLVANAWAGFGAAFGPVIIFSVFWQRMTATGAFFGMATGALTVIVWISWKPFALYEIVPGFIIASLAIVLGSLMTQKPSPSMLNNFEQATREYKRQMQS